MGWDQLASQIPLIGGFLDDSQEQALQQLKNNQALYGGLQVPKFDTYNPDQYKQIGQYSPEEMEAQTISEDPSLRQSQMNVLSKLSGLSDTGLSDVDKQGYMQARDEGAQLAKSNTDAAIQNAQARGVSGSGLEFALREIANQGGAKRTQDAALQQAADSAKNRAMYTQAYGSALGGLRSQDYGVNAANTNILNQFNQANTQNQNQAQMYNLNQGQNIANANVDNRNQARQYNNTMQQQTYADQMQKLGGMSGANTAMAGGYAAENAANSAARNANTKLVAGGMSDLMNSGGGDGNGKKNNSGLMQAAMAL